MPDRSTMHHGPIPRAFAERIWYVLVEECRVYDAPRDRNDFCRYLANINDGGVYWPMISGEFYNNFFVWRVRDYHGGRTAMIDAANARLDELRREFMEGEQQ